MLVVYMKILFALKLSRYVLFLGKVMFAKL